MQQLKNDLLLKDEQLLKSNDQHTRQKNMINELNSEVEHLKYKMETKEQKLLDHEMILDTIKQKESCSLC